MKRLTSTLILILIIFPTLPIIMDSPEVYSQASTPLPAVGVTLSTSDRVGYGVTGYTSLDGELSIQLYQGVPHQLEVKVMGYKPVVVDVAARNVAGPFPLNVTLEPLALVEGYVTTPDGQPVAGISVSTEYGLTFTDEDGYYAIYVPTNTDVNVSIGELTIYPDKLLELVEGIIIWEELFGEYVPPDFLDYIPIIRPYTSNIYVVSNEVLINVDNPVTQVNITVEFSARIAGTVVFSSGGFIQKGVVSVSGDGWAAVGIIENGSYNVDNNLMNGLANVSISLYGDNWVLTFNQSTQVNINCTLPCETPQNIDFTVPDIVQLSGRLVDRAGRPVANERLIGIFNEGSVLTIMLTDENGFFSGYMPANSNGNLTILVSSFPLLAIPVSSGTTPVNLGDVTIDANIYFITGSITGYDPNDLYWMGTGIAAEATPQLLPVSLTFPGEVYDNGSFKVKVYSNIAIQGFPIDMQFSLKLLSSYRAYLATPVNLGSITSDVANVNISVTVPPTFELRVTVLADGEPPMPQPMKLTRIARYGDMTFNMSVFSDTYVNFASILFIYPDGGELYILLFTIPGSGQYTIMIPSDLLVEPYTISYYSSISNSWEPLPATFGTASKSVDSGD
ncbi:MAG TPA: hypothetical protein EYH44_01890, partial [Thermoprotei archaeon]|nr:hypothetical protein [Thermoprotei archaeon]